MLSVWSMHSKMVWKLGWKALVVVAVILQWCPMEQVSAGNTTAEPLISFSDETEEIPNVVVLNWAEGQFILDDLNWALAIDDDEGPLQLDITLVHYQSSLSEIDIDEPAARADGRIPLDFQFIYSFDGKTDTITVFNLSNTTTVWALESLSYVYSSEVYPESVNDTSQDTILIALIQGSNCSTLNFTVQYRGENLAPPVLSYSPSDGDVTYFEGDYDSVPIIDGNFTIEDFDHPSYLVQSASIEIVNYNNEDVLSLTNTTLACKYENGVLSITEEASVEEYEAAINSIVYNNTVEEPTSSIKRIIINVMDSPVFMPTIPTNNPMDVANTSTSNSVNITVNVMNIDDIPNPVLNNLSLTEEDEPVRINLTTIDSTDPMDNYTSGSLILTPASAEIESIIFNGPSLPGISVTSDYYNITVTGLGSKADYNYIFRNVTYQWNSTNGNLGSGYLTLTVTDCGGNTATVMANVTVDDAVDHAPIFGFAPNDTDRSSLIYPTTLNTSDVIMYDITDPVSFLNNAYLRDDRQLKNITIKATNLSATDELIWNDTLQGFSYTNTSNGITTCHIFSGNIYDELEWEMFLMSFSFRQGNERVAYRNIGNRTVTVTVQDCSNSVTVTTIINVLPLPPVVMILLQNTTFTEGEGFIYFLNEFPMIAVIQDQDALFISLTITLQINGGELGPTEMLYTALSSNELMSGLINETGTLHTVVFSKPDGISDEVVRRAIQSIVYLNYEPEPRAFDANGNPLLRKIIISTVDELSRSFQTSFSIRIIPVNDNRPVIRLFTAGNCSFNSTGGPSRYKRTAPPDSKRLKHHSTLRHQHHMVPHVTEIYGELTDEKCAAYIVMRFSATVSHPYVDIWPRLSLVLSLYPDYLSNQRPMGSWDDQDTLIIAFPEHNCSEWNYNDSHVTFKPSNEPCHSPVECLTGICYSNYSGCRIEGTFAINFTTSSNRAIDCVYPPTSAPSLTDLWAFNILLVTVVFLSSAISFYFIWKHFSKRLRTTQDVPLNPPIHPSQSIKQNKRKRSSKSATIAKLAKQQPVSNVATVTQKRSHNYYHGDDDCTLLLPDRDDNNINVKTSSVEDVTSNKDATNATSETAVTLTAENTVTRRIKREDTSPSHSNMFSTTDSSHDSASHTNTPQRPVITDSVFPSGTS